MALFLSKTDKFTIWSLSPCWNVAKDGSIIIDDNFFQRIDQEVPIVGMGSGDSSLVLNLTKEIEEVEKPLFEQVRDEVVWEEMYHKGNPVPRLVCMQGTFVENEEGEVTSEPIYRHPADSQPPMRAWTQTVDKLRHLISRRINQPLNHALIQWYRCGDDYISEHADKTLDIDRGSLIVNLSLGATRTMVLRDKKGEREGRIEVRPGTRPTRRMQRVSLQNGSLFLLGWNTNKRMTHEIRQDRRAVKSAHELAFGGHRVSLTFRYVTTFLRLGDGLLFGQGAPCKTEAGLQTVVGKSRAKEEETAETIRLIEAFSAENRLPNFDWDQHYGRGFSVMNMARMCATPPPVGMVELNQFAPSLSPVSLQPYKLLMAWSGVLVLVYSGFPSSLVALKEHLNDLTTLRKENFGSLWPKTSLGATTDNAEPLSLQGLILLRDLCNKYSPMLEETCVPVQEVSLVKYDKRSLESPSNVTRIPLTGPTHPEVCSSLEKARVQEVLSEWEGEKIGPYLDKVNAAGSRISTYRTESPSGSTVVAFLPQNKGLLSIIGAFKKEVDEQFPGRFCWFNVDALHCTIRSLDVANS